MIYFLVVIIIFSIFTKISFASTIKVIVYYPEKNINKDFIAEANPPYTVFGFSFTTCQSQQSTSACPG